MSATAVSEMIALHGEPGAGELTDVLLEVLADGGRPAGLRRLKEGVYRLELTGGPYRSVVLKRLDPAVAQRARLAAERWLPALGLGDCCPCLLGVAADRAGRVIWHIYEDLGDDTLAARPTPERVGATVDLLAELHVRGAHHAVLPDVRRYAGDLGLEYFTANIADATAALEALVASGMAPPPAHAGVAGRLLERLRALAADAPRRARAHEAAGPDTLLHGDPWTINAFVIETDAGPRARFVDWDKAAVGPFTYDLSTFLFRFPPPERPEILDRYREALARAGRRLPPEPELSLLFDTAERARYANRIIWPALALVQERAAWGFPELVEVERWFVDLDRSEPR